MPKRTTPPTTNTDFDARMMARALRLARRGEGRVEPNPMVGCVIAKGGRIIGEGYHRRFGGPHAEVHALDACTTSPRGATAYVTLEPCCAHEGKKTPPCADALIRAGLARVVAGATDPNPAVDGRGAKQLRKAGIAVEIGVLAEEAADLIAPFTAFTRLRRPYVIAKWAQSLDGKVATRTGDSQWITGEESRRLVHRLRARVDAILVGVGTVLADDPMLTAREVPIRRRATRVVLDSHLHTPRAAQLVRTTGDIPTLILTTVGATKSADARRLTACGVQIEACRSDRRRVVIDDCLTRLHARGVTNLLVEGGPGVLTSMVLASAVDEAWVFIAAKLIGGDGASAVESLGVSKLSSARAFTIAETRRCGEDVLVRLRRTPNR